MISDPLLVALAVLVTVVALLEARAAWRRGAYGIAVLLWLGALACAALALDALVRLTGGWR